MTQVLVKLFIKEYQNTKDAKVRTSYGILASVVGIICNVILFVIKLSLGLFISSISVMADAFNNLSDGASSIVGLIGVRLAGRPADKEHPFGHGRVEYISAFIVAFIILEVGFTCFKNAISKIKNPEDVGFSWIIIGILIVSIIIKLWLSLFNRQLGNTINSSVMKATATDALGDVFITISTIVSLIMGKYTGINVDGYMGLIVSIFVLFSGYNIAKETLEPLLGEAVELETYEKITSKVESYEGIIGSHDLIVHNYGPSHTMATIHAEVPNHVSIEISHEVIDKIERDVLRELGIFLVIHMDPVEVKNALLMEKKQEVTDIINREEPSATIHDFRMVNEEEKITLIFDLVLPYTYDKVRGEELVNKVKDEMKDRDGSYNYIVTIENSFIAER